MRGKKEPFQRRKYLSKGNPKVEDLEIFQPTEIAKKKNEKASSGEDAKGVPEKSLGKEIMSVTPGAN